MNKRNHIIHKQTIEVEMLLGKSPFATQEKIRQIYYDKVLPRLDSLFSGMVADDLIIRIDRLDLDLGPVEGDKLEQQFVEATLRAVQKNLEEKLRFDAQDSRDITAIRVQRSVADIFLYFLEWGRLPWWSSIHALSRLEAELMEEGVMDARFSADARALIGKDPDALERLMLQFSDAFLRSFAQACYPAGPSGAPEENIASFKEGQEEFMARYKASGKDYEAKGKNRTGDGKGPAVEPLPGKEAPSGKMAGPAGKEKRKDGRGPVTAAEEPEKTATEGGRGATGDGKEADPDELRKNPQKRMGDPGLQQVGSAAKESSSSPEGSAGKRSDGGPAEPGTSGGKKPPPGSSHEDILPPPGRHPEKDKTEFSPSKKNKGKDRYPGISPDDGDAIYCELAGLVILHPFLYEFFTALHLMEDRSFRDEEALHKAVHLLGYMATGEEDMEEQRLVFAKILCGMELSRPVKRTGVIGREEMEEAENLLNTVISYWTALKSTSAAGLRDSFLKREGKLTRKDDGWQMDVEKKTLDILLGKLPWGFSIIRLSWMKEMLFVNWC